MENLSHTLKQQATVLHACHKGLREWPSTPQGLIERWKRHLDFAIDRDFPSTGFIRDHFDPDLLHRNLIYLDEHITLDHAPGGTYVILGQCTGTLIFKEWAAATIYLRHASRITIIAQDHAKVFVRLYDDARCDACELGDGVVKVRSK